jgi:hypothetical protein
MLARTLRRPRCGIPMQTSSSPSSAAASRIRSSIGDDGLAALEGEALLADELGLQEGLEGLGGVEPAQDAHLLVARRLGVADLDLPGSTALLGVLDVHVLDADGAAVGVAQDPEDLAQLAGRARRRSPPVAKCRSRSHRVRPWLVTSRSGWRRCGTPAGRVGHEVAAHPVGVDELLHPGDLVDVVVVRGGDVLDPADRLVGDAQALEDLVVEPVLAEQQLVDRSAGSRRSGRPG